MNLSVSTIDKQEFSSLLNEDANKLGWMYSQEDIDYYFNYPDNKIFKIQVDSHLAGCVLLHHSTENIYSVGLFLVKEQYRGLNRVGPYLWHNAITAQLSPHLIFCFHSVPGAVNFYEKLGFRNTSLTDVNYVLHANEYNPNLCELTSAQLNQGMIKKLNRTDLGEIDQFNRHLFIKSSGEGLQHFLHNWLQRPDATILAYYLNGTIEGYGVATINKRLSDSRDYYRISPIYAQSALVAGCILKALVNEVFELGGTRADLNSLAHPDTLFGTILSEVGFVERGINYVVCNQPHLINKDAPVLNHIFASIPLEYPHEIISSL